MIWSIMRFTHETVNIEGSFTSDVEIVGTVVYI